MVMPVGTPPKTLGGFGAFAASEADVDRLLARACAEIARGLDVSHAKILEYLPDRNELLVRAGVGWDDRVVGLATLQPDLESPAGYSLQTGKPTIANDLATEQRFRVPGLLREHGVRSAVNVIIRTHEFAFGVLEADSRDLREFDERDVQFLQGYANILGLALAQIRLTQQNYALTQRLDLLLNELTHRTKNNNQMLLAMLEVQKRHHPMQEVKHVLDEVSGRIIALDEVTRMIMLDPAHGEVDLGQYVISLVDGLLKLDAERGARIRLDTQVAFVSVSSGEAQALGLIVNEFVTNSFKHALADGKGSLGIALKQDGERFVLELRDDGPGFDQDKQKNGLGLRIIGMLADQIGAELAWTTNGSTQLHIKLSAARAIANRS